MKILLINPPNSGKSIPEEEFGIKSIKMIFRGEPLALEVLAGNLSDHTVEIADLKVEPDSLRGHLESFKPDIVGITGVTCEANSVLKIAGEVKNHHSSSIVVAGGHHASCDPEFFNQSYIDYVVVGLGKSSFRELIFAVEEGKNRKIIPGVAKTAPGKPLFYIPRKYSTDDLVIEKEPCYELVEKYRDKYVMSGVGGRTAFVAAAFGCTHKCSFCSIPRITGGRYLTGSIHSVLRDIRLLGDIPLIRLVDANSFGNIEFSENLAKKLIDSGIRKKLVADVRADTIVNYPKLFSIWKEAGLETVVIGFEDVCNERLAQYNKKNTLLINTEALRILKEIDIKVIGDFIVSPDYGHKEFERLEEFVSENRIDLPMPSILTPIPGTPLGEMMKDKIEIHDLDYYTFLNAVIPTKLEKKIFYETFSSLMKTFHKQIRD